MKLKKLWPLIGILGILLFPGFALAQPDVVTATGGDVVTAEAAVATAVAEVSTDVEAEIPLEELLQMFGKAISDWRVLGWIFGILGFIALLIAALRFKPINNWLDKHGKKYLKVYISAGLGALTGFFTSFQTGAGWVQSILIGLAAGWAVIGAHQTVTKANKPKVGKPK